MPGSVNTERQNIPSFKHGSWIFFLLQILMLLISCQQSTVTNKSVLKSGKAEPGTKKADTILNSITGDVDKQLFTVICKNGYHLFVLNDKRDTVYQDSIYSPHQKFIDFNRDGYKDIWIEYITNTPGIADLLVYSKTERTYKKVIDFQNFPASERIGNSSYYYSYHRSGCADMNWDSDLFYIENYKAVKVGNIHGRECNDTEVKNGIYIHKIVGNNSIEVARLPIGIIKKYKEYKWGFIKDYWQKNYKKFLSDKTSQDKF